MKNCPNCGMELDDEVQQCSLCGYSFNIVTENENVQSDINDTYVVEYNKEKDNVDNSIIDDTKNECKTHKNVQSKLSTPIIIISIFCVILLIAVLVLGYFIVSGNNKNSNKTKPVSSNVSTTVTTTTTVTTATTEPTTTTTTRPTTTKTTTTTTTTTTKATTTKLNLSNLSGIYDGESSYGEFLVLTLDISNNDSCYWQYSLLSSSRTITKAYFDGAGKIENNTIYFNNIIGMFDDSHSGYFILKTKNKIEACVDGEKVTLTRR